MFHFAYFADKPPAITLFMGRISTFERIRKYDPIVNSYDFNDCLSIETGGKEKVIEMWACPMQGVSGWR